MPDLVRPGLRLLLVGINPSLHTAATGNHFGNPANRLWPALHAAGLTPRRLHPGESERLLDEGIGVTNLVARATAAAAELTAEEIRAGAARVEAVVRRWRPAAVAFLGVSAYRTAYRRPRATVGPQQHAIDGVPVWVLPNPSGLNAHYQLDDLARLYGELAAATDPPRRGSAGSGAPGR